MLLTTLSPGPARAANSRLSCFGASQQVEDLEVQPHDGGEEAPGRVPLHEAWRAAADPIVYDGEIYEQVESGDMHMTTLIAYRPGSGWSRTAS